NHLPLDESSFIASNLRTISSSLPLLPTTSVENFPEPHNQSQLRLLKNNLLSPQHRSFVSDSGIVGSLHSSSCRIFFVTSNEASSSCYTITKSWNISTYDD
ncbi:unnamed protein product, partial [Musa acuminata var. zebrina]